MEHRVAYVAVIGHSPDQKRMRIGVAIEDDYRVETRLSQCGVEELIRPGDQASYTRLVAVRFRTVSRSQASTSLACLLSFAKV